MSRGHGRWQRLILAGVAASDEGVVLTSCDDTEAEQVSIRRAAHSLERAGLVVLKHEVVEGRRRLVAHRRAGVATGRGAYCGPHDES